MWKDGSMKLLLKILLYTGAFACAALSAWLLFCCFGMWFIGPPRDLSVSLAHDLLVRAGMMALFIAISGVLAVLVRRALKKAAGWAKGLHPPVHRPDGVVGVGQCV
jgi:uncharacterized membrane protein HdeD (DUF308 family)